jgi:phosphopantothenoylcysteine decarboxylase/phosphopantothenate--cysteine ligase
MSSTSHPLRDRRVVLGVSGGIAAYKALELTRLLTGAGAAVHVVMSERARRFVTELSFQTLSGHPVFTDLFDLRQESQIGHIQLADSADLVIVAPATASALARLAAGMADDVLSAVVLATRAPVLLAPSMNVNMWNHPLTQGNLRRLTSEAGARVVGPGDGFLACRWTGPGRLAEPVDIVEAAARLLTRADLAGRKIVVTAGPTHEDLDPVRFLGNRSSGKMGFALARAAARRGAAVQLIAGPVELADPPGIAVQRVRDARAMREAVWTAAWDGDAVIMAAAVADFRPVSVAPDKLKKADLGRSPRIELERNPDILAELGAERARRGATTPVLVGFAAETRAAEEAARHKLAAKGCDLVVANDVSQADAGFAVDTNRVVLVDAAAATPLALASKDEIAHGILDRVAALLAATAPRGAS